ncbi:MAG: tetratricopeptide repeat protein [Candidatus Poribacteria bacterium]|nr:tetratricopeptide repeat protein [Candidatus Poribacteria bacterium]
MLYLKATSLQSDAEYDDAAAEFKQFVAKYPKSDDVDNAQLQIGNSYRQQGDYGAAVDAYRLVAGDGDAIDEATFAIGDAYLMLGRQTDALASYHTLIEKYPYLNNDFARAAQDRIDALIQLDTLRTDLKTVPPTQQDNAQYQIANLYFNIGYYDIASREFEKGYIDYPESELVDDAMWMRGECYWRKARQAPVMPLQTPEQEAFIRVQRIADRYPQFAELDRYDTDGYPHAPAGRRGDRYELYYAEMRRLLHRYPDLRKWRLEDFLFSDDATAFEIWFDLIHKYPDTNMNSAAPRRIAARLVELGNIYRNLSMDDFASLLFKKSLEAFPTPGAHVGLAYYYADVRGEVRWTYYRTRIFQHLQEAASMVTPDSEQAMEINRLKTWMNYRLRIESLEAKSFR